jgi:GT2 family glycosyltransferase
MQAVTIVIPVYNKLELTVSCIVSLKKHINNSQFVLGESVHILVYNDGSEDDTESYLKSNFKDIHLLTGPGNYWWTKSINAAVRYSINNLNSSYILLWNNDINCSDNYFERIYTLINDSSNSNKLIGSLVFDLHTNILISRGGFFNNQNGNFGMLCEDNEEKNISWITGMGSLIPVSIIKKINYWNDISFPHYFGDADFTMRARMAGFKLVVDRDLLIFNDTKNSGYQHDGSILRFAKSFFVINSYYNLRLRLKILKFYSLNIPSYVFLLSFYFSIFLNFLKYKLKKLKATLTHNNAFKIF